jgi:pimeloyl-ACP methyl ester carboxylesterase
MLLALFALSGCKSLALGVFDNDPGDLIQKYGDEDSRWMDVGGLNVHYKDEGKRDGKAIVLIHGVMASLHTWDAWAEGLKDEYRVIRLDVPSFGLTGPANFEFNEMTMREFFDEFLGKLNVDKFSVAGNSLGGYMAWKFAVYAPERIENLVLIDAVGYPHEIPGPLKWYTTPVLRCIATQMTPRWIFDIGLESTYGDSEKLTEEVADRCYDLLLRDGNRPAAREVLMYVSSRREEYPEEIAAIKTRTLIMWGDKDVWLPVDDSKKFKKDMPHAEVIVYEGVGHVPMEEAPEKTLRDLRAFLAGSD